MSEPATTPTADTDRETFGGAVAARRAAVGLTQAQVAERAKIGRGALATIETGGQEIRARDVAPLLQALAVPDGEWPRYVRLVHLDAEWAKGASER